MLFRSRSGLDSDSEARLLGRRAGGGTHRREHSLAALLAALARNPNTSARAAPLLGGWRQWTQAHILAAAPCYGNKHSCLERGSPPAPDGYAHAGAIYAGGVGLGPERAEELETRPIRQRNVSQWPRCKASGPRLEAGKPAGRAPVRSWGGDTASRRSGGIRQQTSLALRRRRACASQIGRAHV